MELPKLPSGYKYEANCLYRDGEAISNFIVCPSILYRRQGESFPFACDLDIYQGGEIKRIPRTLLNSLTDNWWKNPLPGCWYNPEKRRAAKYLRVIFQNCFQEVSTIDVIQATEIGWLTLPSGDKVYVTGSEVIGEKPDGCTIWLPSTPEKWVFETAPDCSDEMAMQYFWDLFSLMPGITDILLVYSFSSFLFPIFQSAGLRSRFPIILEGATGSKKTTLACLTCGAFARQTNPRSCVVGLTSTHCALEMRAEQMRHCTLIVDDLFPDGGRTQQEKALKLIRDLFNQDIRETKSGHALAGSKMECGIVITAEFFPVCGVSTRTRCLRLKLQAPVANSMLQPFQEKAAYLSNAFLESIRRVASQYDALIAKITADFETYRRRRSAENAPAIQSERLAEIGFFLFESLDVLLSIFPQEDSNSILAGFQRRLNNWLDWQLSPEAAPDFRDVIFEIPSIQRQYSGYFKYHHGCWCIQPDELCALLCNRFENYSLDRAYIIKLLRERGALMMDESGAATKKIGHQRYLHIIPSRLERP